MTLEGEGIDRRYRNVDQPKLQCEGQVAACSRCQRGRPCASSALMDPRSKAFIARVERCTQQHQVPLLTFAKGQRKEEVALEDRAKFRGTEGILFVGKAQEKTPVFRTEQRKHPKTGQTYPWIVKSTALVNHFYFSGIDEDFHPFFLKFCTYFPDNAKLCINGHEYVKRQLAQEGIVLEALDNGLLSCADPSACSNWAPVCPAPRSTPCCGSGGRACRTPLPTQIARRATARTSPSSRPSSP